MSLSRWLWQFAQPRLPRSSDVAKKRSRVLPQIEVLEDRLTPSGDVLAFTTAAQSLGTYAPSQTITVQLQDGSGHPVSAASNVTISLSSTSSSGQFLNTSGTPLAHPSLTIPKGASSVSFEYEDTQVGIPTLQAKAAALNLQTSQQELNGVFFDFGSYSSRTAQLGRPSQPISVELVTENGSSFSAPSAVTVQLTSSSKTGQFLDASGKPLTNGRLTIPGGSKSANFEYEDSQAGISTLSVSGNGWVWTTQINVGTSLVFTTPTQTIKAGQPSGTMTLQLQDSHGKAVIAPSTLNVFLSSNSGYGQFFDGSGRNLNLLPSGLTIPAGSSSVHFKYEDSLGGKPILTAVQVDPSGEEMGLSATQQETVAGPYQLKLSVPAQKITLNEPSQPMTVQLFDSTGNLATASSAVTVQLSSSSGTGKFFDASGKALSNGRLIIPTGSKTASFEYKDSKAGFPTLTATEIGVTSQQQGILSSQQQVNVGVSLVFTTHAQTFKAGQHSGTITLQLQDSNGKAFAAPADLTVNLSSNSETGQFLLSGNPYPSVGLSLDAGYSSVSFQYEDSMGGKPTLTASVDAGTGYVYANLSTSQQETVVGPYRVMMGTPPPFTPLNAASQPISVQLFDSTGSVAKTNSAVTVQLSSSSGTGQFLNASGTALSNRLLTIPAGSNSANFEYKDSKAGFPTLTATEIGVTSQQSVYSTSQQQVNVGVSLVFTTPVQNLKAGQLSKTITVQLQDSNGKAFPTPSFLNLSLGSNSLTGQFLDSSGNPLSPFLSLPVGSSSFSFKYKDSMGGKPTLAATMAGQSGFQFSAMQQETVAGPYKVVFSTLSQMTAIAQNKPSQPITVQLQDSTGNGATAGSAVKVQLTSTSSTGQFLDASSKPLSNGFLIIPAGSSSPSFEYKDSQVGLPTLTASANGSSSPTQVNVGVSLVFSTPAQTFKMGQASQPITVQLQDSHGKAFVAPVAVPITLSSSLSTVQFFNIGSTMGPAEVIIPAGSSSASFAITSSWGGKTTLSASSMGMPLSATQQETIQGLSALVFTTSPQTLAVGQKSQRVTLQLQDNNGKAAVAPSGGLTMNLLTLNPSGIPTPSGGNPIVQFFDANGNPLPPFGTPPSFNGSTLTMPAGSSTVSFAFETTQAGSLSLSAQLSNGLTTKQVETIQAGPPRSLVFQTPAQALPVGVPSGSITVQLEDQYGNPVAAGAGGLTFNLRSSSSGGTFLSADGDPLAGSKITVPQGLSSATFEYKDSQAGTPTLTASANGFSAAQKESIVPVSTEIHVTNTKDSGSGSLRAAILTADANPGSTIVFDSGVRSAIDLLSALPAILANMNILGPGANLLTVERSALAPTNFGIFQVGTVSSTVQPTVVLSGLTVANGTQTGITNLGYLTLQRVVVRDNQAAATSVSSGVWYGNSGIENFGALTVLNSTIADNSTKPVAPGIAAAGIDSKSGSVLVINSTISGNKSIDREAAGGIGIYGGTALIESSTISGNTAADPWSNNGGGLDSDGLVTLYDTIVAGNTGSGTNPTDVSGAFVSLGHNLIGEANPQSSGFVRSDLVGTTAKPIDPKLGALSNNGGPTPTLALLNGSPALGAGSSANAPATDQRGDARPQRTNDIGAFERTTS